MLKAKTIRRLEPVVFIGGMDRFALVDGREQLRIRCPNGPLDLLVSFFVWWLTLKMGQVDYDCCS